MKDAVAAWWRRTALAAGCLAGCVLAPWSFAGTAEGVATARNPLRFAVVGGTEGSGPHHQAVMEQILKCQPELVLHAGGLVSDGRRPADWQAFDQLIQPLLKASRFYPCRARNDISLLHEGRYRPEGVTWGGTTYYAFAYRGAQFIALDSSLPTAAGDPQTRWLGEELAAADGKPIFVYFHRPIFTVSGKPNHGSGRVFWAPLFAKHKVRAVFSADYHIYYRTMADGVTYVEAGGGGAPLDEVRARHNLMPTDVAGAFHHCIEVIVAGDRVRARVVDSEGRTRDEFLIPPPPEEQPAAE